MTPATIERTKYETIWQFGSYRKFSPGLESVDRFMSIIDPKPGRTLCDFGCGEGKAGLEFEKRGLKVSYVDITDSALHPDIDRDKFTRGPIWRYAGPKFDLAYCCDVMEHIPTEFTMLTLDKIISSAAISWFQICNVPDEFGRLIGEPLHLTVRPFTWWRDRISEIGSLMDARDMCGNSLFVVAR